MPNKKQVKVVKTTTQTQQTNATVQRSKPKKTQRVPKLGAQLTPAWFNAVRDPFDHEPVSVPDEQTQPSLKYTSLSKFVLATTDVSAVPSVSHGLHVAITPELLADSLGGVNNGMWISKRDYNTTNSVFTGNIQNVVRQPPNFNAMFPPVKILNSSATPTVGYQYRMTAMQVRLQYGGTELDRAGRVITGLAECDPTYALTGTEWNAHNRTYGYGVNSLPDQTTQDVQNRFRRVTQVRNNDGTHIITWVPLGTPAYRQMTRWDPAATAPVGSTRVLPGSDTLHIVITGDTTPGAAVTGNNWYFSVCCHWEVLPLSRFVLASAPTPSAYDPAALTYCLNHFQQLSTLVEEGFGGSYDVQDGRQSTTGLTWERFQKLGGSLFQGASKAYDTFNTPHGRQAAAVMMRLIQSQNPNPQLRLTYPQA